MEPEPLTDYEIDLLNKLIGGMAVKTIALDEHTIKQRIHERLWRIRDKLRARNNYQMIAFYVTMYKDRGGDGRLRSIN